MPCDAVRLPSKKDIQTNNSANFTQRISLHTNINTYLNHGYVSDIQHILPLGYRSTSKSQNLSRSNGQTIKENPLLNYKIAVEDDHIIDLRETSRNSQRYLRQTTSKEDSNPRSGYISNIYSNSPQSSNQENKEPLNRKVLHKRDNFRISERLGNASPFSYRQSGSGYKFRSEEDSRPLRQLQRDHPNLSYRQISNDSSPYNTRQTAVNAEERSEQAEERRLGGPHYMKMSSEEQELMLLDALHHKTNSTSRGFEATLADMLGKSESNSIRFQYV
jgi:hypothetical protein